MGWPSSHKIRRVPSRRSVPFSSVIHRRGSGGRGYACGQFLGFHGYNLHNYTRHGRVRNAKKKKTGQGSLNRVAIIGRKRMRG